MKLLLDTHVLLWWLGDMEELGERARALLAAPENVLFVSAASVWEIRIKHALGKLTLPSDFAAILNDEPFERLSVTIAHAHAVGDLPAHHRDSFDRILIAQARCDDLTLVTRDEVANQYDVAVELI